MTFGKPVIARRSHRLVAILLLVLVVACVVALFALPTFWLHKRYDDLLDDYTNRLQRYQRIAALRPAIEAATHEVEKRNGKMFYLHAASPNLAAAELQSLATRIVEKHKARVVSSQIRAEKDDGKSKGLQKVGIQLHFAAPIIPLQLILHSIESHVPYLFIEQGTITSRHGRSYKLEPGVQPEYDIQLTIAGYVLPGAVPP